MSFGASLKWPFRELHFGTSALASCFNPPGDYTSTDSTTIYDALKLSAVVVSIAFILHISSGIFSAHMHTSRLTVINLTLKFNKQLSASAC